MARQARRASRGFMRHVEFGPVYNGVDPKCRSHLGRSVIRISDITQRSRVPRRVRRHPYGPVLLYGIAAPGVAHGDCPNTFQMGDANPAQALAVRRW